MDALLFRTRIAALWLGVAIALVGSLLLFLFVPGALEEMLAGEMEGEPLDDAMGFMFAAMAIFPLVMVGVTLLVSHRVNLVANTIAGTAFGLFGVFAVTSHLVAGDFNGHIVMVALAGVGAFLIAGLALVGLRHPTSQPAERASKPGRYHEASTV